MSNAVFLIERPILGLSRFMIATFAPQTMKPFVDHDGPGVSAFAATHAFATLEREGQVKWE